METKTPKNFWLVVGGAGLLILLIALYMIWSGATAETGIKDFERDAQYEKAEQAMNDLEAALKADTYGGQTPEETLKLFIEALKKGDIDLAAKYFALDTNTQSPDYLTRNKWEEGLKQAQKENRIPEIVKLTENARPAGSSLEGYVGFEVRNETKELVSDINLRLNKQSQVWKIESL